MILDFYYTQIFTNVKKDYIQSEIDLNISEFSSISWRYNDNQLKLYNSKFKYNLENLPTEFELQDFKIYWYKIKHQPPWVLVTKISVVYKGIEFKNINILASWITNTLQDLQKYNSEDITGIDKNNRTCNTICITEIEKLNIFKQKFYESELVSYGPNTFLYKDFLSNQFDTFCFIPNAEKHRSGGSILNGQTILYFFINSLLLKHILSDVTGLSFPYICQLKSLENPSTKNILLENYRIFLAAKIYFSTRMLVKYWEHDIPIWDYFFENHDIQFDLDATEKEVNGIIELGTHAAAISAADSSYNTSIAATVIGLIGLIGALAGIIQAIDNPKLPVPFETKGSLIRLFLILGISIFLLIISGAYIFYNKKLRNKFKKYID